MEDRSCRALIRLSKGVHVLLRTSGEWRAGVAAHLEDGRHACAVPCEDMVLLGATDEEYCGEPRHVRAEPRDVAALLDLTVAFLQPEALRPGAVTSAFAGLRVLPLEGGTTAAASRGHLLDVGSGGMVSVAGES